MTPQQIEKAQAIAAFFNLPKDGENDSWLHRYLLPDGGFMTFRASQHDRGQLHINVCLTHDLQYHAPGYYDSQPQPTTSINVNPAKPTEKICVEIKRRLMPGYKQFKADCEKAKASHDDHNRQQIAALSAVAEPFGESVALNTDGSPVPVRIYDHAGLNLEAEPYCDNLRLKICVTPEIARQLATFLAQLCPRKL